MKEEEIRPKKVFNEYLKLSRKDSKKYFLNAKKQNILCPACFAQGEYSFTKYSFDYSCCKNCQTLYVSPRPINEAFIEYYTKSKSAKYWATTFYRITADNRRNKLWKPKAKAIHNKVVSYLGGNVDVFDIGGGYGIFGEEFTKLTGSVVTVIEPSSDFAKSCRSRNINVIEKFLEDVELSDLPRKRKVFVSFELFEHLHSPEKFLKKLRSLMLPKDIFIFTTLSGNGVDIQALWENSKSVSPPHHLNFLNPYSVQILLKRIGLKCLEVTTPGKLDIDILTNSVDLIKDNFFKTFILNATEKEKKQWQEMISNTGWSSHMMVICQKP